MLEECTKIIHLVLDIYKQLGFDDIAIKLSTRPEKRMGSDGIWDILEAALIDSLEALELDYKLNPGEGAFYGPKLEFVLRDAIGRDWQCGTLQVDMNLPKRFELDYVDEDGNKKTPVMLHRALFGSLERFIGILIEHHAGKFPAWLAPVQVAIMTISEPFNEYALEVGKSFDRANIRLEYDIGREKIGYKIRRQTLQKVPFMIVIGAQEAEKSQVTLRHITGEQTTFTNIQDAIDYVSDKCKAPDIV